MNKLKFFLIVLAFLAAAVFIISKSKTKTGPDEVVTEIGPTIGSIQNIISTTGTVLPKNRLEIKPPVGGRIESVLVQEGQDVKIGQTLAWMSSTDRAALLDAARGKGEAELKYWQEAYKPIELLAPIDGEVIVATTQPGQNVTVNDAVVVLSDHLIVRAQVDETDIGKIKLGQKAMIMLDAYPETKIKGSVEHIYYESKTVNNVTIYEVDLIPEEVMKFFRSGMNATIDFITNSKDDALLIPLEAVHREKNENYVLVKQGFGRQPAKRVVTLGITDDKFAQVLSGIDAKDVLITKAKKYALPKSNVGSNPFMPVRKKKESTSK